MSPGASDAILEALRDAETVLAQLGGWFDDYNTQAPHSAIGMRPPAEYRVALTLSSPGEQ